MEKSKTEIKLQLAAQLAAGYISAVGTGQEPSEVVRYSMDMAELMMAAAEKPAPQPITMIVPAAKKPGRKPKAAV